MLDWCGMLMSAVNDCSAEDVLLAHGPFSPPSANVAILPASVAGYTWDGGPVASLPLLVFTQAGASVAQVALYSDAGNEATQAMPQTAVLEGGDEGCVAVASRHNRLFSPLVENVK